MGFSRPSVLALGARVSLITMSSKRRYDAARAAELISTDPNDQTAAREITKRKRRKPLPEAEIEELRRIYARRWMTFPLLHKVEQETGKIFKRGKFSQKEHKVIREALQEFLDARSLTMQDFIHNFFLSKHTSSEVHQDSRFASLFPFVAQKTDGRPVISVYLAMRRTFNPGNYQGRWNQKDDAELIRLYSLMGPDWQNIGIHLGRFGICCRDRFKSLRTTGLSGPWSEEETQRLIDAVSEVRRIADGKPCWMLVSHKVETRSASQCLSKWAFLEMKIKNPNQRSIWTEELDYNYICRLYDLAVEHESEIIWREVAAESDWPAFVNANSLRSRFHVLKKRVRNAQSMDLDGLLETLMLNLRPSPLTDGSPVASKAGDTKST